MHPQSLVGRSLADPHDAWAWLDARCSTLGIEAVSTDRAAGRVSAGTIVADNPIPASSAAATDGFALPAASTVGAGEYNPLPIRIGPAEAAAGNVAVCVAAGAAMPRGADAVLSIDDADPSGEILELTTALAAGENVVPAGSEAAAGDVLVPTGRRLTARDVALLHLAGFSRVDVVRRPRAAIVCVRDASLRASPAMVAALLETWGCTVEAIEFAGGNPVDFGESLGASDADLLVSIGGTGAGDDDFAVARLSAVGEVRFHGVAIHPGERIALGAIGTRTVIQLPGRPLPCLAAAELFVKRAVRNLSGCRSPNDARPARLSRKIASRLGRLELCRVALEGEMARPLAVADGTTLATAVRANGYVLVPIRSEGYDAGANVPVHLFDDSP